MDMLATRLLEQPSFSSAVPVTLTRQWHPTQGGIENEMRYLLGLA
jgi:hypothetical protein